MKRIPTAAARIRQLAGQTRWSGNGWLADRIMECLTESSDPGFATFLMQQRLRVLAVTIQNDNALGAGFVRRLADEIGKMTTNTGEPPIRTSTSDAPWRDRPSFLDRIVEKKG